MALQIRLVGRSAKTCPHCGENLTPKLMTKADQLEAIVLRHKGKSIQWIANKYKRDYSTIRRLMQRNGIRKNAPAQVTSSDRQSASKYNPPVIPNSEG